MSCVLLVAVDAEARAPLESVRQQLTDLTFDAVPTVADALRVLPTASPPVAAVVLGTSLDAPVQALQRLYAEAPRLPVLILCRQDRCAALSDALRFAPFIGSDVACASVEDGATLSDSLQQTIRTARSHQQFQATVSALNARLEQLRPIEPPVAVNVGRLLEAMPVGVVALDGAGRVQAWNRAATDLFGPTEEAVLGTAFGDTLSPDNRRQLQERLAAADVTAGGHLTMSIGWEEAPRHLDISLTPLTGRSGEAGVMLICQDVTERVLRERERARHEADRQRLITDLQEAVDVRDNFLSIASHELKTPLTSLKLYIDALLRTAGPGGDERLRGRLQTILRQSDRMNRLINDMLDVSRITAGRLHFEVEPTDLAEVVAEVAANIQPDCERVGSTLAVAVEPVQGMWDRFRLDQIVTNLLTNAVKFGGGRPIEVSLTRDQEVARLVVRDYGQGIAPEDQGRLFQRFSRLVSSRHFGGFGLGLWIVQQIVQAMGGHISLKSGVGEGATFTVVLPLSGSGDDHPSDVAGISGRG
jgi:PAS domain S-box-containing protein